MSTLQIKYLKNLHQEEFHSDEVSRILHLSAGFGCMIESSLIETNSGKKPFGDITQKDKYLSWDNENSKFIYSSGILPYPKKKDDLYRVILENEEFVASESHLVFCDNYKYQSLASLIDQHEKNLFYPNLFQTNKEFYPLKSFLNVRHLKNIILNCLGDCLAYFHQYGPQPRPLTNNGLSFSPLLNDALKYGHYFLRSGDYQGQEQAYNHLYQYYNQTCKNDFFHLFERLFLDEVNHISSSQPVHILEDNQQSPQFLLNYAYHYISQLLNLNHTLPNETPYTKSLTLNKTPILSIEKIGHDWVWDTHVFNTNNYVSSGCIHHNSGKTYSLIMKIIKLSFINKGLDGGLVAPSFPEMKKDVLPTLEEIAIENDFEYKHHKSDNWIKFPWSTGKVWLASAERKIRGPNWAFAGINEVTLLQEKSYKEVLGRVRVKKAKLSQIVMSGTPEGTEHWLYKNLIENKNPYANVIYGDTRNNAHNLDPIYLKSLEESFDAVMLDAYLKGLWVNMKGNRFYYSYDPEKNCMPNLYRQDYPVLIAMDFNVNPMTCTLWHKHEGTIYGFDEITLMSADTKKLCDAIKARGYKPEMCTIYPDPSAKARKTSGKSDIQILKEEGFTNILYKPKAPDMRKRQLNVNNLLDKEQIIINKETMPKLHQDLQSVSQDPISLGKDKKNMDLTHWSDGLDYLCDIEFPFSGKKPSVKAFQHNF